MRFAQSPGALYKSPRYSDLNRQLILFLTLNNHDTHAVFDFLIWNEFMVRLSFRSGLRDVGGHGSPKLPPLILGHGSKIGRCFCRIC
jgi:hypothetical protein